jgi:hypothetical protein
MTDSTVSVSAKHNVVKFVCKVDGATRTVFFKGETAVGFLNCCLSRATSDDGRYLYAQVGYYSGRAKKPYEGCGSLPHAHWVELWKYFKAYVTKCGYGYTVAKNPNSEQYFNVTAGQAEKPEAECSKEEFSDVDQSSDTHLV